MTSPSQAPHPRAAFIFTEPTLQTEAQGSEATPPRLEPVGNELRVWSPDTPQPATLGAHGAPTRAKSFSAPSP